ncbi:MAG TPA: isoprenylcysteine carboxylmethyltransferase family protein [Rhizomicrobium sp.]
MLQQILTGQARSFALLVWAVLLFAYFLPSVVAFTRAHRRFFIILVLNLLVSPVQGAALHFLAPALLTVNAQDLGGTVLSALAVNFGLGWLLLLAWSLAPTMPDAWLVRARNSKAYDAVAALPLILWFLYGALQLRPTLVTDLALIGAGRGGLFAWVQFFSLSAALLFDLLLVYVLVVRDKPVLKARGVLPRFFGFLGTFLGVGILQLPVAHLTLPAQMLAAVLVGLGSLGSVLVLWWLGKAFSIMPEARRLVTAGPYAHVRHPLYGVEIVTIIGTAVQFAQPWATLIAIAVMALLWIRSGYEEGVLAQAYPEYESYRARTRRFIPGII